MSQFVRIGHRNVGPGCPVFFVAEIGINHNGSLELAKQLIDGAIAAGCDAVKFQKRTPELRYCRGRGILWFASCWDEPSVDFMERLGPPCYKAASASLTDHALLRKMKRTGRPLMLSTGMSTMDEIDHAVDAAGLGDLLIAHSTSLYPCPPELLNLRMIGTLEERFPSCPVGYSGHEVGLAPSCAAVAMGARFVERHITLDRTLWGTDQGASVDIGGLIRLLSSIRDIERSLGDGVKHVYPLEHAARTKLRRVRPDEAVIVNLFP